MKKRVIFFLFILVIFFGCTWDNLPDGVLSRKKMVPILVDIHLSEAINNQRYNLSLNKDSLPEDLYLSICKKYKVDRAIIEKSLIYYGKHARAYIPVYDEVLNVLSEMEVKAKNDTLRPVHVRAFDLDSLKNKKPSDPLVKTDATIK
jgi:hypothetical protein